MGPTNGGNDVPISIYRRQRLLRALGHLPRNRILPPARSVPRAVPASDVHRRGQHRGDFACITWNAQAFLAQGDARHAAKARYAESLMARGDVLLITEAHRTAG
eukprot:5438646-Pyramimonas_sp.AAC.1